MKFLCGGCRTKYQISDEKIRSKILTIRCKKCGAKILVRESLAREAGGTAVAPLAEEEKAAIAGGVSVQAEQRAGAAAVQAGGAALASAFDVAMRGEVEDDMPTCIAPTPSNLEAAGVEWYIAIDGEQSGPFAYAEIVRRVQAKEIIGRHYVWHDGMDGWKRVREMPDLAAFLSGEGKKKQPPPPPNTTDLSDRPISKSGGAEVVDFATKRKERDQRKGTATGEREIIHDLDAPEAGVPLDAESAGAVAVATTAGLAQEAGLPDKKGEQDPTTFDKDDIFANVPRANQADLVRKESTRFFVAAAGVNRTRSQKRLAMVVGITICACFLIFIGAWAAGIVNVKIPGIGNPFDKMFGRVPEETADLGDETIDPKALLGPDGKARARNGHGAGRKRTARASNDYISDKPRADGVSGPRGDDAETIAIDVQSGAVPEVPTAEMPKVDTSVALPPVDGQTLSQNQITQVVNNSKKSVAICYQQSLRGNEDLRGKLIFRVLIDPTGVVSHATVDTPAFKGTKLAHCIAAKIKDWKFPTFRGQPQEVEVPFILEKNSF